MLQGLHLDVYESFAYVISYPKVQVLLYLHLYQSVPINKVEIIIHNMIE